MRSAGSVALFDFYSFFLSPSAVVMDGQVALVPPSQTPNRAHLPFFRLLLDRPFLFFASLKKRRKKKKNRPARQADSPGTLLGATAGMEIKQHLTTKKKKSILTKIAMSPPTFSVVSMQPSHTLFRPSRKTDGCMLQYPRPLVSAGGPFTARRSLRGTCHHALSKCIACFFASSPSLFAESTPTPLNSP